MAIIVVAEKRTLCSLIKSVLTRVNIMLVHCRLRTEDTPYHSNAPNITAPLAAPQTLPLQNLNPERRTAAARKPANQNIMVTASAARMAYLCAAAGKKRGESARYGTANAQVQILQKRRKLICEGDMSE